MPPQVSLPDGHALPALGLGTWRYAESARFRAAELAALRRAIELGYRLFDTAEMYGDGGAETLLGEAVADALRAGDVAREALCIVSKVMPQNASRRGTRAACERSRKRLRLDRIDVYLLHWRGAHALAETVDALQSLCADGHVGRWGVSNFDVPDLRELWHVDGGDRCAVNQVYYSLSERGVEYDLVPWQRARGMPLMAYCPIDQGALSSSPALAAIAARLGATPAQVALAWLGRRGDTIAIPKAVREAHLRENLAAADVALDGATLAALDAAFPPPRSKRPLMTT
jgi:diketogulonate reductase-like aldo/keto reductase